MSSRESQSSFSTRNGVVLVKDKLLRQANSIRARWRKIVTGQETKRVRDFLKEKEKQPQLFKLIDKIGFTFGVLNIVACQYFLLNIPHYFSMWFVLIIPTILATRFLHFKSQHWHYFMIDFCYFGIALSLVNVLLARQSATFFKMCFIFATGTSLAVSSE
jgi:hypothetical protein